MSQRIFVSIASLLVSAAVASPAAALPSPLERAREAVARLDTEAMALQATLRGARSNRDTERAICLDDALTRLHVAARSGRALRDTITAAAVAGDGRAVEINLVRLEHLGERTQRLFQSAQRCGADARSFGAGLASTVSVVAPPGPEDATAYPK